MRGGERERVAWVMVAAVEMNGWMQWGEEDEERGRVLRVGGRLVCGVIVRACVCVSMWDTIIISNTVEILLFYFSVLWFVFFVLICSSLYFCSFVFVIRHSFTHNETLTLALFLFVIIHFIFFSTKEAAEGRNDKRREIQWSCIVLRTPEYLFFSI